MLNFRPTDEREKKQIIQSEQTIFKNISETPTLRKVFVFFFSKNKHLFLFRKYKTTKKNIEIETKIEEKRKRMKDRENLLKFVEIYKIFISFVMSQFC